MYTGRASNSPLVGHTPLGLGKEERLRLLRGAEHVAVFVKAPNKPRKHFHKVAEQHQLVRIEPGRQIQTQARGRTRIGLGWARSNRRCVKKQPQPPPPGAILLRM